VSRSHAGALWQLRQWRRRRKWRWWDRRWWDLRRRHAVGKPEFLGAGLGVRHRRSPFIDADNGSGPPRRSRNDDDPSGLRCEVHARSFAHHDDGDDRW
jgi:hypothetical protein